MQFTRSTLVVRETGRVLGWATSWWVGGDEYMRTVTESFDGQYRGDDAWDLMEHVANSGVVDAPGPNLGTILTWKAA